jgi:hypothetical protein
MKVKVIKPTWLDRADLLIIGFCIYGLVQTLNQDTHGVLDWIVVAGCAVLLLLEARDFVWNFFEYAEYRLHRDEYNEHIRLREQIIKLLRRQSKNWPKNENGTQHDGDRVWYKHKFMAPYYCTLAIEGDEIWDVMSGTTRLIDTVYRYCIDIRQGPPVLIKYDAQTTYYDEDGLKSSYVWFAKSHFREEMKDPLSHRASLDELRLLHGYLLANGR